MYKRQHLYIWILPIILFQIVLISLVTFRAVSYTHLDVYKRQRLPVPGYTKLKSISSKRAESFGNGTPHEGMYTRQELKDLSLIHI